MSFSHELVSFNLPLSLQQKNLTNVQDSKYSKFLLSKLQAMADVEIEELEDSVNNSTISDDSIVLYASAFGTSKDNIDIRNLIELIQ